MRNLKEFPVTANEIESCLLKLSDDISSEQGMGDMRPFLLREAVKALATVRTTTPVVPVGPTALDTLLSHSLLPNEIEGSPDVRERRAAELVIWFAYHSQGDTNHVWFGAHAYELAAYVARLKSL